MDHPAGQCALCGQPLPEEPPPDVNRLLDQIDREKAENQMCDP